jgi:hypothetical protein
MMKFKMKRELTPTLLRLILTGSLFGTTLIGILVFAFADGRLEQFATDVSHTVIDADASQNSLTTLQKVKTMLANEQDVITRTNNIVADSQSYQYQDQIITDLDQYASRAGIEISNVTFGTAKTTPAAVPAVLGGAVPSGVKSTSVTVALVNPVNYEHLLGFIESVEQNLTKMQISRVSISKAGSGDDVSSDVLTIEVFVR